MRESIPKTTFSTVKLSSTVLIASLLSERPVNASKMEVSNPSGDEAEVSLLILSKTFWTSGEAIVWMTESRVGLAAEVTFYQTPPAT